MDSGKIETQILDGLAKKAARTRRRRRLVQNARLAPRFDGLKDSDCAELFAGLKQLRWRLHHATTSYNLSVAQRRRHNPVNSFMVFAGQNTNYLTLSRMCLKRYSKNEEISSTAIIEHAADHNIGRTTVFEFFNSATEEGVFVKREPNYYDYTEAALDNQFENLVSLLFNSETWNFYKNLELAYGAIEVAAKSEATGFRATGPTRMAELIKLRDQLDEQSTPEEKS
tara:strand:- start:405 stop:1082 length:678 start_codon:yes stop_codon:yes gene_type:complete